MQGDTPGRPWPRHLEPPVAGFSFKECRLTLSEADVVPVDQAPGADEAGLRRDEGEVHLVAEAARRTDRQGAFVDAGRERLRLR
jgi:hypothetical protein